MKIDIGRFDLDIQLRDEAVNERNSPVQRMLANAVIGVEPYDAYYAVRELRENLKSVFEGDPGAKARLARLLSNECDDLQRCLYYQVAGRGVVQMLDAMEWLEDILNARALLCGDLLRSKKPLAIMLNPYVAPEPDGPIVSPAADFREGASWYLDPELGGEIDAE